MFRVLCICIDFIDFHSANLRLCAPGKSDCQTPVTAGSGWEITLQSCSPDPTSSPPPKHNRACAKRGDTNDPALRLWGLQSRPLCFPNAMQRSWGPRPPTPSPTVNTIALEKSWARAISLSLARPAREAPTPASSVAESLPERFPAAPAAALLTEE